MFRRYLLQKPVVFGNSTAAWPPILSGCVGCRRETGFAEKGATFVAETELLPVIPSGPSDEIVASQANLGPEANVLTHKHSGPETWFLLTGEQSLELPDRTVRARAGQTMSAPAESCHEAQYHRPSDALFLVVHDSSNSWNIFDDWQPKGVCQKYELPGRTGGY